MTDWTDVHVDIAGPVAEALASGAPVVALESTIITHGMPFPDNDRMARLVEDTVIGEGAVPATIAVMDGRLKIGLDDAERAALAQAHKPLKLSRADLAHAIAMGRTGGTTVAATMIGAQLAGIEVFATGGIGGVHRGAETSFDISADLEELGRTSVIVVSAGAKAILDIAKTLEVLETKGVPVIGYQTDKVPAFWSRTSSHAAPIRLDTPEEIARFHGVRHAMGITGGVLVTNPVPADAEIPQQEMEAFIAQAVEEAAAAEVAGKDVTPFLLSRLVELTQGRSLRTNIALVENNARLAARIAIALKAGRGA